MSTTRGRKRRRQQLRLAAGWLARRYDNGRTFVLASEVEEWTGLRSAPCGVSVRLGLDRGDGLAVRVPGGWVLRAMDRICHS